MTQAPQPVDERLRAAAAGLDGDRVCKQTLADAHGPHAQGALLLLIAAPCLLPLSGVGTVLGLGLAALALAMWRGNTISRLLERVGQLHISRQSAQRVLGFLASTYTMAGNAHARAWLILRRLDRVQSPPFWSCSCRSMS